MYCVLNVYVCVFVCACVRRIYIIILYTKSIQIWIIVYFSQLSRPIVLSVTLSLYLWHSLFVPLTMYAWSCLVSSINYCKNNINVRLFLYMYTCVCMCVGMCVPMLYLIISCQRHIYPQAPNHFINVFYCCTKIALIYIYLVSCVFSCNLIYICWLYLSFSHISSPLCVSTDNYLLLFLK